jgi:hypothetical protein
MVEKETKKERYILKEVPTETALVIEDTKTLETLTQLELLLRISNDIKEIKETIIGK